MSLRGVERALGAAPVDSRLSNPGPDPEELALGTEVEWEGRVERRRALLETELRAYETVR